MSIEELQEYLKTAKNRAEIALLLIGLERLDLLFTVLEDLHHTTQLILDNYCIVDK